MTTIERLNLIIDYMEEHLHEDISLDIMADMFGNSKSVLQKTFFSICELPISEYIRRRRLSEAAFDLRNGSRVLDTAINYQYQSVDAFTRAFKQQHNSTPSQVKKDNMPITSFTRIVFTLSIKGIKAMNYKIEKRSAMRIIGYKTFVDKTNTTVNPIPKLWDEFSETNGIKLMRASNQVIPGMIGVNGEMHDGGFDYWIAVTSDQNIEGLEEYEIPACDWLKIEAKGALRPEPLALQEAYRHFFNDWLPFSNYEHAGYAEIEYYPMMGSDQFSDDFVSEIWVSIKTKEKEK